MTFKELNIIPRILDALNDKGYDTPTPIQAEAIPILLKGKDLLGCAQTGTGKTAAFTIPIIQNIYGAKKTNGNTRPTISCLIVTPTRELAIQINDNIDEYGKYTNVKSTVIFGGVKQGKQVKALQKGVDILVATPGRLLDLIQQKFLSLRDIEYFVLDEADQMLDMGFIHDIKKIIALLPSKRQSLFFSATMPDDIVKLSRKILGDYETVTIQPEQTTAEKVDQFLYYVKKKDKIKLLQHLWETENMETALVFSRTKHGADKIVKMLRSADIKAQAIHGNKSQVARQKALAEFKDGHIHMLIATDIAARGIDISELSHVINYDLPNIAETYVHRIGRTGRANASGIAISFCNGEERAYLKGIQRLINQTITVKNHPYEDDGSQDEPAEKSSVDFRRNKPRGNRINGQNSNGQGRKKAYAERRNA